MADPTYEDQSKKLFGIPINPLTAGAGAGLLGFGLSALTGVGRTQGRDFFQFMNRFREEFGPQQFGLSPSELAYANQQAGEIKNIGDVNTVRGLSVLRAQGRGRSAQAAGLGLQSASSAERNLAMFASKIAALSASVAEQQRSSLNSAGIAGYQAATGEDARIRDYNTEQAAGLMSSIQDPIESYILYDELRKIRALYGTRWSKDDEGGYV